MQRSASIQPRTSPKYKCEVSMILVLLLFSPDLLVQVHRLFVRPFNVGVIERPSVSTRGRLQCARGRRKPNQRARARSGLEVSEVLQQRCPPEGHNLLSELRKDRRRVGVDKLLPLPRPPLHLLCLALLLASFLRLGRLRKRSCNARL